ncbi:hypothetical protein DASC09_059520 [Saccharomycopsis crataegensis]|uniref:ATPase expression protein 2, mitochondrial n=1 Tax=Saccharomycopsis crataegensis TaxID=43959 RepID=A0AAV5QUK7_9ASCO|nr:hypothetical protein DASC09_059520 [Saccharomycopsis crataegensis]
MLLRNTGKAKCLQLLASRSFTSTSKIPTSNTATPITSASSVNPIINNELSKTIQPLQTDKKVDKILNKSTKQIRRAWRREYYIKKSANKLEKRITEVINSNMDHKSDHGNISTLRLFGELVEPGNQAAVVRAMTYENFRLILVKTLECQKYYSKRASELRKLYNLNKSGINIASTKNVTTGASSIEDGNASVNALVSQNLQIKKDLQFVKEMENKCLRLTRDFFGIFNSDPKFNEQLTIADYEQILKMELANDKPDKAYRIIKAIEKKFPIDDDKVIIDTGFWNLKFKTLVCASPKFWQYKNSRFPKSGAIPAGYQNWKGKLPFEINLPRLLQEFTTLSESGRLVPNLETHTNLILALGYNGSIDLLRNQLKSIWGVAPGIEDKSELVNLSKDDPLYPDIEILKAVVTAFSFNSEYLEAIAYLSEFDTKYNFHDVKVSGKPAVGSIWEICFKWADYNTKLPSEASLKDNADLFGDEESAIDNVDEFLDKISQERAVLLDNIFNSYLATTNGNSPTTRILNMRFRQLKQSGRLDQMIKELPIFYNAYLSRSDDKILCSLYFNYWINILNVSMMGELSNLEAISKDVNSEPNNISIINKQIIKDFRENNGPVFMYTVSQQNLNSLKKEIGYQKLSTESNNLVDSLKEKLGKRSLCNVEILKLLYFYKPHGQIFFQILEEKYVQLSSQIIEQRKNISKQYDEEDDESFFGIF